jgi:16S rRNA (cytosine967-C5)-methyltransferase
MSAKIHNVWLQAIYDVVHQVFHKNVMADKALERCFKLRPKFGSKDRAFVAEYSYDIIRHYRRLAWILDQPYEHFDLEIEAVVDILYFEKNGTFIKASSSSVLEEKIKNSHQESAMGFSLPDWLFEHYQASLQDKNLTELKVMNSIAPVYIRVNTIKTTREDLLQLIQDGLADNARSIGDFGITFDKKQSIFTWDIFKQGLFEMQDIGSQMIAPALEAAPGMRVVDACAGAGGKTLHLACLMGGKGQIIALDVEGYKLDILKTRAKRAQIFNVETRTIDTTKTIKRLHNSADRLLLDVPCSGSGVLRRNPDAKWKIKPERITELVEIQAEILEHYPKMLKIGGIMVYATCSLFHEENEAQIDRFLEKYSEKFKLLDMKTIYPSEHNSDGFFIAKLTRYA